MHNRFSLYPVLPCVLGLSAAILVAGCAPGTGGTGKATHVAYSCDNTAVIDGTPCFAPDDPKHMSIAFRDQPHGDVVVRVQESGRGVPVEVLSTRTVRGETWFRVTYRDAAATGWIHGAYVLEADEHD